MPWPHEINDIPPMLFPRESFDLIHLSFLSRYILAVDFPALAQMCVALCRPGGVLCWTEAELPITTSPAFERLTSLVCETLQRAGQSFIPEARWEVAEHVAACAGITATVAAHGITYSFDRPLVTSTPTRLPFHHPLYHT